MSLYIIKNRNMFDKDDIFKWNKYKKYLLKEKIVDVLCNSEFCCWVTISVSMFDKY